MEGTERFVEFKHFLDIFLHDGENKFVGAVGQDAESGGIVHTRIRGADVFIDESGVAKEGFDAFGGDIAIGQRGIERLDALVENGAEEAVVEFFGDFFLFFDFGDVFEIKFQAAFHVSVQG